MPSDATLAAKFRKWEDYYDENIHPLRKAADEGHDSYVAYDDAYHDYLVEIYHMVVDHLAAEDDEVAP